MICHINGNKSHGFWPVHLQELLKYDHLQLPLSIMSMKTSLNTHHLNVMGRAILLDNECQIVAKFARQIKMHFCIHLFLYLSMRCCYAVSVQTQLM